MRAALAGPRVRRPWRRIASVATALSLTAGFAVLGLGSGTPAADAASATTGAVKSVAATRTHLVDGADVVADTRNVTVSVDVTSGLRDRQPVNISWTGAHPTGGCGADPNSGLAASLEYPVVILQCRGTDSSTAAVTASPETCWTQTPRERYVSTNSVWPAFRLDRYAAADQRTSSFGLPAPLPATCVGQSNGTDHWVRFVASDKSVYYGGPGGCGGLAPEATENEGDTPSNTTYARTDLAGNGSARFIISTGDSNASLGCSSTVKCSLVVVPVMGISCDAAGTGLPLVDQPPSRFRPLIRQACAATGNYDPAVSKPMVSDTEEQAVSGRLWWSASNWRNRISFPLQFAPPSNTCDIVSSAKPVLIYGSQVMRQATLQWSPEFCTNPKLFKFQHVQTAEPQAKSLLDAGQIEAALAGAPALEPFTRPVAQAPIAVSGFAVVFTIDDADGNPLQRLRLNARLLAKLLTGSYATNPTISGENANVSGNPLDLGRDPEFKALNPSALSLGYDTEPAATLFTVSSDSDVVRSLTDYIDADPEARAWLDGTPDPWGMKVNKAFEKIDLPVQAWPQNDTFVSPLLAQTNPCLAENPTPWSNLVAGPVSDPATVALNMQYGIANSQIVCKNPGASNQKLTGMGRQAPGRRFVVGVVSLPDARRYQLAAAELQTDADSVPTEAFTSADGRSFVAPTNAALGRALALLKPDKTSGTWPVDHAALRSAAGATAYPGTMLMTIDVPTQGLPAPDAARLADFIRWTTSTGQKPGSANGQLPEGYLPLSASAAGKKLAAYSNEAAAAVDAQQGYVPAVDGSSTPPASPTPTAAPSQSARPPVVSPSQEPVPTSDPTSSPTATASPSTSPSDVQVVAVGTTKRVTTGNARAVLPALVVVAVAAGAAAAGLGLWRRP